MSPGDVELAKILITAGGELVSLAIEWFRTGERPKPERVAAVWSTIEQAKAKLLTDAAADARWPTERDASIIVNGSTVASPRVLTYERAVSLAGMTGTPSVTFRKTAGLVQNGMLLPGGSVEVDASTVINVAHTGDA